MRYYNNNNMFLIMLRVLSRRPARSDIAMQLLLKYTY